MSAQPVADIPQCVGCYQMWLPRDTDHWQAYWVNNGVGDELAGEVLLFYCPACAKRVARRTS